jgi:hypothetical protein
MSYIIISPKGTVYYEACSLEEAKQVCPIGYTIQEYY